MRCAGSVRAAARRRAWAAAGPLRAAGGGGARWSGCQALVLNTGSSSIKYGVYDVVGPGDARLACRGLVEGVGLPPGGGAHRHQAEGAPEQRHQVDVADHGAGLQRIFDLLPQETLDSIRVVGHRVVNGGASFTAPAVIDDEVESAIRASLPLAPLHNPANLSGIQAARAVWGEVPHVAVFDTSFHAAMPAESFLYAVPKEWYEKYGVRRYGFHGTSYSYVLGRVASELQRPASSLNLIVCHIGSGASMVCIKEGRSLDTTMGFTPLDGLVMGTRSGDVDAGVFGHLTKAAGLSVGEVDSALNKKSGLYGLCGFSDMRAVQERADGGDADAALAERIFVERVRKYLGAYLVRLRNNVDAIVFTAGVGENSARFRALACEGLEEFGIKIAPGKNLAAKGVARIEDAFSRTKVMVVPTDEEGSIAIQAIDLVGVLPEPAQEVPAALPGRRRRPKHDLLVVGESSHSTTVAEELGIGSLVFPAVTAYRGTCGYFRILSDGPEDGHVQLMRDHFHLEGTHQDMHGMTIKEAVDLGVETGSYDEVLQKIVHKFQAYRKGKDFVLVGGHFVTDAGRQLCSDFAAAMRVPVLLVQSTRTSSGGVDCPMARTATTLDDVKRAHVSLRQHCHDMQERGASLAGVIVSGVPAGLSEGLRSALVGSGLRPWALLPPDASLEAHTAAELASRLGATVLCGAEAADRCELHHCRVITAHLEDFLRHIADLPRVLVVVDGGRSDVLYSLLFAAGSSGGPDIAAVLLTGVAELNKHTMQVLAGAKAPFPVLVRSTSTFPTLMDIAGLQQAISPRSATKIASAVGAMERFVDRGALEGVFVEEGEGLAAESFLPPKMFQLRLLQEARAAPKRLVLPEGHVPRVVVAAAELTRRGICKVTLLGDPATVAQIAKAENADLSGVEVIDHHRSDLVSQLATSMVKIRERKGLSLEGARLKLRNENYFGTMLLAEGLCDGVVVGAASQPMNSLRPAMQLVPRQSDGGTLSSVHIMLLPEGVKILGDCAINVHPDAGQLAEIVAQSVATALRFGIEPRVAMLPRDDRPGAPEAGLWLDEAAEAAGRLAALRAGRAVPLLAGSPLEVAVDPVAARQAALSQRQLAHDPERRVAGQASVLVFPDLQSAQAAAHAMAQASRCAALGPVLQGLARPVNSILPGSSVEDIVTTAAVTCVQAG